MSLLHQLARRFPHYQFSVSYGDSKGRGESFSIEQKGRVFLMKVESHLAKSYALSRLQSGLKSGYIRDVVGKSNPQFEYRPLWITKTKRFTLPSLLEIDLPDWVDEVLHDEALLLDTIHELVLEAIDCGMNMLFFAPCEGEAVEVAKNPLSWKALRLVLDFIKEQEIRVGLHFSSPPYQADAHKSWSDAIAVLYSSFDYLIIHQGALSLPAGDKTQWEQAKEEIHIIERSIKVPLVYVLKQQDDNGGKRQAEWMPRLSKEISPATLLFFSATLYAPFSFSTTLHPYLMKLSTELVGSFDTIIPWLSVSEIVLSDGESIPYFGMDLIEEVVGCQRENRLHGAALAVRAVASPHSLPRLAAWVIGQRMWQFQSTARLIKEGIQRDFPELPEVMVHTLLQYLDQVLVCYGSVRRIASILYDRNRPYEKERIRIEIFRLAAQFEAFCLTLHALASSCDPGLVRKAQSLSTTLVKLQLFIAHFLEEQIQAHSLKTPPFLLGYSPVAL